MGTLGFSYVGLIYLAMLFIPNGIWTRHKPEGYDALAAREPRWLKILESTGQVMVTAMSVAFADFNLRPWDGGCLWLAASFALMVLYEICWIRYFAGPHTMAAFYGGFLGIPVPLATLPVGAFLLLGIYGRVVWMVLATAVLGVGHVGIHLRHWRQVRALK